jgi:hypothetical protein
MSSRTPPWHATTAAFGLGFSPDGSLFCSVAIGTFAFVIAMLSVVFIVTNTGPQFDAVIVNDHVVGGTGDKLAAFVIGSLSGAVAVICAIRLRKLD